MWRNIVYAAACYPFGALGDRFGRKWLLVLGYGIAVLTFIGFILAPPGLVLYGLLFGLCGIYIAAEDTLESAVAGEMVEERCRGLGFGALATMNGVGDLCSSILSGSSGRSWATLPGLPLPRLLPERERS
jgi:MFS family permease